MRPSATTAVRIVVLPSTLLLMTSLIQDLIVPFSSMPITSCPFWMV
jgi:hypothetical protein